MLSWFLNELTPNYSLTNCLIILLHSHLLEKIRASSKLTVCKYFLDKGNKSLLMAWLFSRDLVQGSVATIKSAIIAHIVRIRNHCHAQLQLEMSRFYSWENAP